MKKSGKFILFILVAILVTASAFLITVHLISRSDVEKSTDINDYIAYTSGEPSRDEASVVMPKLDTLGNFTDTDFYYCCKTNVLYDLTVYRLAVSYEEDDYEKEKALLDERYPFYGSPIFESEAADHELTVNFEYSGYSFRTVRDDYNADLLYPKRMFFVGTNNRERKIIYLCYSDSELDYVTDFASFFDEEGITVKNKK